VLRELNHNGPKKLAVAAEVFEAEGSYLLLAGIFDAKIAK